MALSIKIGADVNESVAGIELVKNALSELAAKGGVSIGALENALKDFQLRLKAATDPKDIARLQAGISGLSQKIKELKGLGAGSFDALTRSSNSANLALINTGRVIQDLPFGFLGIANNLNPLLESFQRLKADTGSTTSALGGMVKALSGGAGLGLALSVVSSLLIQFGSSIFGTVKSFSEAEIAAGKFSAELDKIGKAADDLKDRLDFENKIGKLKDQVAGLKGIDLTIAGTKRDIEEAGKLNISANVDVEKLKQTKEIFDKIAESIRQAGRDAIAFGGKATGLGKLLLEFNDPRKIPTTLIEGLTERDQIALAKYKELLTEFDNATKRTVDSARDVSALLIQAQQNQNDKVAQDLEDANKKRDEALAKYKTFVSETIARGKELANFFEETRVVPTFSIFDTDQQQFKKAFDFLKQLEIGDITIKLSKVNLPDLESKIIEEARERTRAAADKLKNDLQTILTEKLSDLKVNVKPTIQINPELLSANNQADLLKPVSEQILALGGTLPPIDLTQPFKVNAKLLDEALLQAQVNDSINKALEGISVEGFSAIGEAIGAALTGGDIGSVFKQFGITLGSAVQALGKHLIQLGVIALATRKAVAKALTTPAGPAVLIAAGIAMVALGAALKSALSKGIQGFAKGGRPPVGVDVLVGEKGPEIMRFDRPGTVIPAHETKRILNQTNNPIGLQPAQVKELVSEVSRVVIERLTTVSRETNQRLSNTIEKLLTTVNNLGDTIKNIHNVNTFGDQIKNVTNNLTQSFLKTFTTIIPARAQGGRVDPYKPHLVGEKGVEIFIPKVPGVIIPHNKLSQFFNTVKSNTTNLFQNISNIQHREFGGPVFPGQQYFTGEVGAEGFFPTGSRLTPVTNTGGIQGAATQSIFIPSVVLKGSDLVLSFNRETGRQGRLV